MNTYPQVFLIECKYIEKEKKMIRYITDDLQISSDSEEKYFLLINASKSFTSMKHLRTVNFFIL